EAQDLAGKLEASLSIIPDAQATIIASALGVPVGKVQRALVMISSGIAQTIKFICLLAAVIMWPRRRNAAQPAASSNNDISETSSGATSKSMPIASPASSPASSASMQAASPAPFAITQTQSFGSVPASLVAQGTMTASPRKMPLDKLYEYLRQHASGL